MVISRKNNLGILCMCVCVCVFACEFVLLFLQWPFGKFCLGSYSTDLFVKKIVFQVFEIFSALLRLSVGA